MKIGTSDLLEDRLPDTVLKPVILTQPNIPKPIHGLSPRTIMGDAWWEVERKKAYRKYDYHCIACGIHQYQAKRHHWLEAHEWMDVNYQTGVCTILSIEPLCHHCHKFIHSGYLSVAMGNQLQEDEVIEILEHGFIILAYNKLTCFSGTLSLAKMLHCNTYGVVVTKRKGVCRVGWEDWRLSWEGKEYQGRFASIYDWKDEYSGSL